MALPQRIASRFVRLFAGFLLSGDSLDFIFESYTPALLAALEDASYGILKRFKIFFGGIGVIVRVVSSVVAKNAVFVIRAPTMSDLLLSQLYAFLWQEELIKGKHLTSRTANFLGAVGVRKVNRLANFLTGFNRRNDRKFQRARNVYPGDKRCRRQVPHSKWHEVIANGLVDVAILCDMINRVFSEQRLHFNLDNELFRCYESSSVFSGFDWQSISSTVSQVFETCSVELLDDWPRPDIGQFTGCMISSMIRAGNEEEAESVGEDTVPPLTLDACLVNNDCIKFDGLQLDVDLLKQCVGLTLEVSYRERFHRAKVINIIPYPFADWSFHFKDKGTPAMQCICRQAANFDVYDALRQ